MVILHNHGMNYSPCNNNSCKNISCNSQPISDLHIMQYEENCMENRLTHLILHQGMIFYGDYKV